MRDITEGFDFNILDTRNWNTFIEYHFRSCLLGRRAFLMSRPAAHLQEVSAKGLNSTSAVKQLTKFVFTKTVHISKITVDDLVLCCADHFNVPSLPLTCTDHIERCRFGKAVVKNPSQNRNEMISNSITNEGMAKIVKKSRS